MQLKLIYVGRYLYSLLTYLTTLGNKKIRVLQINKISCSVQVLISLSNYGFKYLPILTSNLFKTGQVRTMSSRYHDNKLWFGIYVSFLAPSIQLYSVFTMSLSLTIHFERVKYKNRRRKLKYLFYSCHPMMDALRHRRHRIKIQMFKFLKQDVDRCLFFLKLIFFFQFE